MFAKKTSEVSKVNKVLFFYESNAEKLLLAKNEIIIYICFLLYFRTNLEFTTMREQESDPLDKLHSF